MKYDPEKHHRRSIRLKGHDYAGGGLYFVTMCAHREAGRVFASADVRDMVEREWVRSAELRVYVHLGPFVVMPDHFHALIRLDGGGAPLGEVIGAFKAAVTRNRFVLENADALWLPYVAPGGMLARLIKEMNV
jgi:REP element-mobilizing transposase RayT